jgi:hypothetical protein
MWRKSGPLHDATVGQTSCTVLFLLLSDLLYISAFLYSMSNTYVYPLLTASYHKEPLPVFVSHKYIPYEYVQYLSDNNPYVITSRLTCASKSVGI